MNGLRLDRHLEIHRLVDIEQQLSPLRRLFPDGVETAIAQHKHWLFPHFMDPTTGELILAHQSFLIRTCEETVLIDTCVGNHKSRALQPMWNMRSGEYLSRLNALGVSAADIDYVMCTHLHVDHVGWNTQLVDGRWVPTFPNAQYIFSRSEYEARAESAEADHDVVNDAAFRDSVKPIVNSGRALLVAQDYRLNDSIFFEPAPGHTPNHVVINVLSDTRNAVICGDALHHPLQCVYPEWNSRFCEDPPVAALTRMRLLEKHADSESLFLAPHFASPTFGTVTSETGSFRFNVISG